MSLPFEDLFTCLSLTAARHAKNTEYGISHGVQIVTLEEFIDIARGADRTVGVYVGKDDHSAHAAAESMACQPAQVDSLLCWCTHCCVAAAPN